ncbi:hypothetical protein E8A74_43605 [Polyangium fumosum]|uniref:Beta-lactamase-related domain-containing protein n=2 Tax=Polyangium fumosum TaxID=889272 RepID=A0A4U1IU71_9BACT|nr:hypothetical protein E8A74_43605 [Polyangium fumosum]
MHRTRKLNAATVGLFLLPGVMTWSCSQDTQPPNESTSPAENIASAQQAAGIPSILAHNYEDLGPWLSATHCGMQFADRLNSEHEKGCIAAVVHGTRIVAIGASGLAYKDRSFWNAPGAPATKDMEISDAFQLGSISKVYTVLGLSKLIESAPTINGHTLTWESTLADAMPWVNLNTPEWNFRKLKKLKHLVSHRAGYCRDPDRSDDGYCSTKGAACTAGNQATVCDSGSCGTGGTCEMKVCEADDECGIGTCVIPLPGKKYPTPDASYWKPLTPAQMRQEVALFYNDRTNGDPNCPIPVIVDYNDGDDDNDTSYSNTGLFLVAAVIDYWSQTSLENYIQTAQPWGPSVSNTFLGYPASLDRDSTLFTGTAAEKATWIPNLFQETHARIYSKNYAIENGYNAYAVNSWASPGWVPPAPQGSYAVTADDAARFLTRMNRELSPEIKRMTRDPAFFSPTGRNLTLDRRDTTSLSFVQNRTFLQHNGKLYGSTWYQFVPEADIAYIAFVHNTGDDGGAVGKVLADLKQRYPFKNNLGVCGGPVVACNANAECDSGTCDNGLCTELRCDRHADCPLTGSCESTSELGVSHGCTDENGGGVLNVQRFYTNQTQTLSSTKMFGCSGAVTWQNRADLCAPGFHVCDASEYVALNTDNERPLYNYWTDDNLGYRGVAAGGMPPSGNCTVGTGSAYIQCPTGKGPMRVTTDNTTDALGRQVDIIQCGLGGSVQNKWFGGCGTATTNRAGTLCCGDIASLPWSPEEPPPGPPVDCPPEGCGTVEGGLCATVKQSPPLSATDEYWHPDGNFAQNKYCLDDYPDTGIERVCVAYGTNPNEHVGICRTCTNETKWPGCECDPNHVDSCGAQSPELMCIPTTGYNSNGLGTYGSGKCVLVNEALPSWDCQADCTMIYGNTGVCYHREEGGLYAMCVDALDGPDGITCATMGTVWNGTQCENECILPGDCQLRGYPIEFECNVEGRCVL